MDQILDLLLSLQQTQGLSYLLITHNWGVVAKMAHRVVVMRHGQVLEQGRVSDVLSKPTHAYTQSLLAAVPKVIRPLTCLV